MARASDRGSSRICTRNTALEGRGQRAMVRCVNRASVFILFIRSPRNNNHFITEKISSTMKRLQVEQELNRHLHMSELRGVVMEHRLQVRGVPIFNHN